MQIPLPLVWIFGDPNIVVIRFRNFIAVKGRSGTRSKGLVKGELIGGSNAAERKLDSANIFEKLPTHEHFQRKNEPLTAVPQIRGRPAPILPDPQVRSSPNLQCQLHQLTQPQTNMRRNAPSSHNKHTSPNHTITPPA